jgi:site-specific DNA recombinase
MTNANSHRKQDGGGARLRPGAPITEGGPQAGLKRAVIYLRVSTPSQVNTDYNPEGISLPAQRERCELKCSQLGAEVVREFVEPGRTATSIDKRPVFQEMLAWLKHHRDIDFIVVYHFNSLLRNSIDSALTKRDLNKLGTRVVSTIVDLGEGPESAMVETILSAVDEYQSAANGADISYKMGAKARSGGTLGRARLGYVNARDTSEGRNIGIVVFDEERAPLVKTAFQLYSTGDWSIESLQHELCQRGLRSRPGRFPAGPVSTSKLAALLHDPYYIGYVTYKGELIKGRHEALIDQTLFDSVQRILEQRGGRGERQRRHHHYLKGMLWCGRCHNEGVEARMLMQWTQGNGGRYLYFFCSRRQHQGCDSRYLEGDAVEAAVESVYPALRFDAGLAERVRSAMREALAEREQTTVLLGRQLKKELARLDKQEENLIELAAEGGLAVTKVRNRLAAIQMQRDQVAERVDGQEEQLEVGMRLIEGALKLLDEPGGLYRSLAPDQRRLMNLAIFEKLYVFAGTAADAVLRQPFADLLGAQEAVNRGWTYERRSDEPVSWHYHAADRKGLVEDLAAVLFGDGSSKAIMVGTEGLEPSLEAF